MRQKSENRFLTELRIVLVFCVFSVLDVKKNWFLF